MATDAVNTARCFQWIYDPMESLSPPVSPKQWSLVVLSELSQWTADCGSRRKVGTEYSDRDQFRPVIYPNGHQPADVSKASTVPASRANHASRAYWCSQWFRLWFSRLGHSNSQRVTDHGGSVVTGTTLPIFKAARKGLSKVLFKEARKGLSIVLFKVISFIMDTGTTTFASGVRGLEQVLLLSANRRGLRVVPDLMEFALIG